MQSEDVRRSPVVEPLKMLPLTLVSLVVVVGAVDLLLLWQPGILLALRGDWEHAIPSGSSTSTLLAAAVILAAIALSATILTAFVRGVRAAPYLCLAPLWVGLCMLVIGRMPVELPLPLPTPAFVAICALLFVGSGVLFEKSARNANLTGVALGVLPIVVLGLGYALSPRPFDASATMLLFVLSVAAAGAPVIAVACRASGGVLGGGRSTSQHALSEQLDELLARVRESEARAERAERQLALQPAVAPGYGVPGGAPRLTLDDEAALLAPRGGSSRTGWVAGAVFVGVCAGGYFLMVAPLREELAKRESEAAALAERHDEELEAARAQAEHARKLLEQQAAAATQTPPPEPPLSGPSAKAAAALLAADKRSTARKADAPEPDSVDAERDSQLEAARAARLARKEQREAESDEASAQADAEAEERRAARQARRERAAAEREARAAERAAAREQRAADRAAAREARALARSEGSDDEGEAEQEDEAPAPEPKRAPPAPEASPRDSIEADNDDPLEGLDGL